MQDVMHNQHTPTNRSYMHSRSIRYIIWVRNYWKKEWKKVNRIYHHPPHYLAFLCIHHYEGSWTDSGEPFWGGLQMDDSFQLSYGSMLYRLKGTANNWTPLEQIWTAEQAEKSRGFYPWPNTARYCNLLG